MWDKGRIVLTLHGTLRDRIWDQDDIVSQDERKVNWITKQALYHVVSVFLYVQSVNALPCLSLNTTRMIDASEVWSSAVGSLSLNAAGKQSFLSHYLLGL